MIYAQKAIALGGALVDRVTVPIAKRRHYRLETESLPDALCRLLSLFTAEGVAKNFYLGEWKVFF
jgi:hypothetical protein